MSLESPQVSGDQCGIEANPEKIKVVIDMQHLTTIKEVHGLASRAAALCKFVFRSANSCLEIFKILKNPDEFRWTYQGEGIRGLETILDKSSSALYSSA